RVGAGHVLVDYGHNPGAFHAVGTLVSSCPPSRVTAVIGVPGDRADCLIEQAGQTAARLFDRLIIREDVDLRGRKPGEVAEILYRSARAERPSIECTVVFDERAALEPALGQMIPGELAVVFYEHRGAVVSLLEQHGAEPADTWVQATKNALLPV